MSDKFNEELFISEVIIRDLEDKIKQLEAENTDLKKVMGNRSQAFLKHLDELNEAYEENAKLKESVKEWELEAQGQQARAEHFEKLFNDSGWHDASVLPTEDGLYNIAIMCSGKWERLLDNSTLTGTINKIKYISKDMKLDLQFIKWLKLPPVNGESNNWQQYGLE
jgi:hypothetical protein